MLASQFLFDTLQDIVTYKVGVKPAFQTEENKKGVFMKGENDE